MYGNARDSAVRMLEENVTATAPFNRKAGSFECSNDFFPLWRGEAASYGNLLNADEFEWSAVAIVFWEAELDHFAYTLHQCVESFGLRLATAQSGNRGHVVSVFVLLDEHSKFSLGLHVDKL